MSHGEDDEAAIRDQAARVLAELPLAERLLGLLEGEGGYDTELWATAAELGWIAMSAPEAAGGLGLGLEARCVIAEEIGRNLAAIPFTVTTAAMSALARFGSDVLVGHLAQWCASAKVLTFACFEPLEGGVPLRPAARWSDGRLSGRKTGVLAGLQADVALVYAADEHWRPVVVVIDLSARGVTRSGANTLDNSRGYADLAFQDVEATLLGGADVVEALLAELAILTAFEQAGGAAACLEASRDYALVRRAFGRQIGAFQAVKHALADMYVQAELAKGAARAATRPFPTVDFQLAAGARLAASKAYDLCAQEAMQLHGAIGVTWPSPLHLHYRRARCLALEWGGQPVWRDILLRQAFEEAAA